MATASVLESRRGIARPDSTAFESSTVEQAFRALQLGFVVAPILAGADKFFGVLTNWEKYVPGFLSNAIEPATLLPVVGVIEIAAGILVLLNPKVGGLIVAAWLVLIIGGLVTVPGYLDVALRDLGLAIGAFALSRLASARERGA